MKLGKTVCGGDLETWALLLLLELPIGEEQGSHQQQWLVNTTHPLTSWHQAGVGSQAKALLPPFGESSRWIFFTYTRVCMVRVWVLAACLLAEGAMDWKTKVMAYSKAQIILNTHLKWQKAFLLCLKCTKSYVKCWLFQSFSTNVGMCFLFQTLCSISSLNDRENQGCSALLKVKSLLCRWLTWSWENEGFKSRFLIHM